MCGKYNLKRSEKWYEHAPEGVVENEEMKILRVVMIQCDRGLQSHGKDKIVGNKAKGRISKRVFQESKARQRVRIRG